MKCSKLPKEKRLLNPGVHEKSGLPTTSDCMKPVQIYLFFN
jgi:hypothetical protein